MLKSVGSYQLEKLLGQGATARVFLAKHLSLGHAAALKVFHPGLWSDEDFKKRALTEFKTVSALRHPNIVAVTEAIFDEDTPAVVMDYVDGPSLEEFQPRLPYVLPEVSVRIVIEVLKALEHAHAQGVVHRDLKPANILMQSDGRVFVSDFGHAKMADTSRLTITGTILGSPDYMAPEQAQGAAVTPASDLFSAAAILYFLVTGTKPFARHSPLATLAAVISAQYEPAQRRNPKLSPRLARLIERGLAKEVADRFASATEFREELEAYLDSLGLVPDIFNGREWSRAPHETTLRALQTIAERLTTSCEGQLCQGHWEEALETLSHLSAVAPESPQLPRLMDELEAAQRRQKRRRLLLPLVAGFAVLLAVGLATWRLRRAPVNPSPESAAVASTAPVPTTPAPAPIAAEAPVPTRAHVARKSVALPPQETPPNVQFDLPSDVRVFWNGREIDPKQPLPHQIPDVYTLRLEKPGARPIEQTIVVRAGEPTLIRAQ